jgi:uncharacterized membrane protein YgdD (TMEM256/DUF423 family)
MLCLGASGLALGAYGAHGLAKVVGDNPTKIKVNNEK